MKISEIVRTVLGLNSLGMDEKAIIEFLLYVTTGDEQHKPSSAAQLPKPSAK